MVWFWVAGAIGVICTGISVALFISLFSSLADDLTGPLTELQAPGEVSVQLDAGADRTIYRQFREAGTPVATGEQDPSCSVTSDSGAQIEVGDTFEWTLKRSGDRYEAIQDFSVADSGEYRVACETRAGSREPVPLAIGESIAFWDLLRKGGLALALFFGGLLITGAIVIITAVMRDNNKKKLQREALQRSGGAT